MRRREFIAGLGGVAGRGAGAAARDAGDRIYQRQDQGLGCLDAGFIPSWPC
jgi:hypothetical protein